MCPIVRTIKKSPEATIERQYEYGERNVVVVDVLVGSSIESLAKEIDELVIEDYSDFADEIESYKKLESSVIDLSEQESIIKEIENISIEDYSDFADEIESYKKLEESNANLEKAIEQAVSELPKVCPLCGSEIHGGNCV